MGDDATAHPTSRPRSRRLVRPRVIAVVLVAASVATMIALGEPSRPATATVARPIVTVQALCTVPTIVDVAAGEATRGLTAVNELLGRDDPYVGELGRDVTIVETEVATYFVSITGGDLRLAALARTGLPVLAAGSGEGRPRTYRAFSLPADLQRRDAHVVGDDEGVFVLFGGGTSPVSVFQLDTTTISSASAELSGSQDPSGPVLAAPGARMGSAVAHAGELWIASDDGTVWTYDPDVDPADRWTRVADGLLGAALAATDDHVVGVFGAADRAELHRYRASDAGPVVERLDADALVVEAASAPGSAEVVFAVRGGAGQRAGLLRVSDPRPELRWVGDDALVDPAVGLVANAQASAAVVVRGGELEYEVLDRDGELVARFPAGERRSDCVDGGWDDAASVIQPLSVGSLLYLHDPSSPYDCVADTRFPLDDLAARCAPGGDWTIDKGAAPEGDFSVEVGRALSEYELEEDDETAETEEQEPQEVLAEEQQLREELADAGLGIVEVDEELTDRCATEQVTTVVAPTLEDATPVGDRAIRVEWSWDGGECLPQRYLVETCVLSADGADCGDRREFEVPGDGTTSNRFATEVAARPDRTYRVAATALKGGISSRPSNPLLVTLPASVPDPPTNVAASLSGGIWHVSWSSCLDVGDCHQRPDGFVVTVEGCDGDGFPARRHRVGAAERQVRYDLDGSGFPDADLLGRRVRFRVAATASGNTSDSVPAGACRESVRAGRDRAFADSGLDLGLSGRTTTMTLDVPARSASLTQLFGTGSYDGVSARLLRGGTSTPARNGPLGGSIGFEVDRCRVEDWTVELTPRRSGTSLAEHTIRISGVPAACGWAVTERTSTTATISDGDASTYRVSVTIPGLADDVRNDKVASVTATTRCRIALSGERDDALSGGSIDGDTVIFTGTTPAILDLAGACTLRTTLAGTDGATVVPEPADLDLRPVTAGIVQKVRPVVVGALMRSMTAEIAGFWPTQTLIVRSEGSGVGCRLTAGSSEWTFSLSGGREGRSGCTDGQHRLEFRHQHLNSGRASIRFEVGVAGMSISDPLETVDVCALVDGDRRPPCSEPPPPCSFDPELPADDPACQPCIWDDSIGADDPGCFERCPDDPELPIDDPACGDAGDPGDPGDPEDPGDPGEPGDPDDPDDPGSDDDP